MRAEKQDDPVAKKIFVGVSRWTWRRESRRGGDADWSRLERRCAPGGGSSSRAQISSCVDARRDRKSQSESRGTQQNCSGRCR